MTISYVYARWSGRLGLQYLSTIVLYCIYFVISFCVCACVMDFYLTESDRFQSQTDSEISPYRNLSLTLSVAQRRGSSVFSTRPIVRHTRWNVSFIHQRLYAKSKGPNSVCHVFTFSLCGKIQAMVLKQWFKSALFVDKKWPMGHVIVILWPIPPSAAAMGYCNKLVGLPT